MVARRAITPAKTAAAAVTLAIVLALGPMTNSPATGEATSATLPDPPANGMMGFVVERFTPPVIFEKEACPDGPALKLREAYLSRQSPEERERLKLNENEGELTRRWQADIFGPNGANICSQPDMFDRPMVRTVQSKHGWGLDLDQGGKAADICSHEEFSTPTGEAGIDNQDYRVTGCQLEMRGVDGVSNDTEVGMRQFMASGEWTQVLLLRGVNSLKDDPAVEVIYANTPDRPVLDSKGKFLPGTSFTISDKPPRQRNVLRGKIVDGVLTTEPADIALVQTWGQGGARDIRGNRSKYDFRHGRLKLTFQPDGSLTGLIGGYRPVFDLIQSPSFGGFGSALVAGIDCSANLRTLKHYADGLKDPSTGQCQGVSSAMRIGAIPAFVIDR
jgi:hypothetical protein